MEGGEKTGAGEQPLRELLRSRAQEILDRWERAIRARGLSHHLSDPALRDHLPQLLERISGLVRTDDESATTTLSDLTAAHALARLDEGFELAGVIAELALLRQVILELWEQETPTVPVSEVQRLNAALDAATSASITHYSAARERTLRALNRISAAALGTGDLDTFLPRLLDAFREASPVVDAVVILLRDEDHLRVRAAVGMEGAKEAFELKVGQSFAGKIASERTPRTLRVDEAPERFVEQKALKQNRIRILYGVPLLHQGEVLGVAHMGSRTAWDFAPADEQLFRAMAQRATSLLVQAMLLTRERKAKRRLDALLAGAPVGIGFVDPDLRYVQVNEALAAQNGLPAEAHLGKHISEVLPQATLEQVLPALQEVLRTGEPRLALKFETATRGDALQPRSWLASFFPVREPDGDPAGVGAVMLDITERQRALDDAHRRAAELTAVLESIPEGVYVGDRTGIRHANRPALELIGLKPADVLHRDLAELFAKLKARDAQTGAAMSVDDQPFVQALRGQAAVREIRIRNPKTGADRVVRSSSAPICVEDQVVGAVAIHVDITAQKEIEESLRHQEERLRLALDAEQAGLFDDDLQTHVMRWDDRSKALFGIPADRPATPEPVLAAIHPDDRERVFAAFLAATDPALRQPYRVDYRVLVEGRERWVAAQGSTFFDARGEAVRMIGTIKDITDRKRTEAELAQTATFREQFIGILGHDLRNPLGAIRASADLLLRGESLQPAQLRSLTRIVRSSERMSRMISDVLDFARGHLAGGLPIRRQRVDLQGICRRVLDELHVAHPDRKLLFTAQGSALGDFDPDRVAQAVSNLVGNAIQHGAPHSPVEVRLFEESDLVRLEVHNLGPPIPAELLPKLFEPFRGTEHGRGKQKGLGLGLYIVQEIVRAHGGRVEARSSAQEGTTFRVRWPKLGPEGVLT